MSKMLIQKILGGLWVKNFVFSILSSLKISMNNSLYFWNGTLVIIVEIDNLRKNRSSYTSQNLLFAKVSNHNKKFQSSNRSWKTIIKIQVLTPDFTEIISKQAINLIHILKVNFEWKFESIPVKSVLCILKIYANNKLPVFRTNLKLKFWKLLSNS